MQSTEASLLTILMIPQYFYDVVFSPSCHPLKFIPIVTISLVPQILTTLKKRAHLSFPCLVQSACFLWKHNVFWNRLQNQYEDPES